MRATKQLRGLGALVSVGAAQNLLTKGYDLAAIMRAGCSNRITVATYLRFFHHNIWKQCLIFNYLVMPAPMAIKLSIN